MAKPITIKARPQCRLHPDQFAPPPRRFQVGYDASPEAVAFYIPQGVLEELFQHGRSHRSIEVGGYLFGRTYADETRAVVDVCGIYPIVSRDATLCHFRFRIEDSHRAERFLLAHFPGTEIVGWFHTHPGHGVFMSSVDVNTHLRYFAPFHRVAMVVDPIHLTFGAFVRREEDIYSLANLWVVAAEDWQTPAPLPRAFASPEPADPPAAADQAPTRPQDEKRAEPPSPGASGLRAREAVGEVAPARLWSWRRLWWVAALLAGLGSLLFWHFS